MQHSCALGTLLRWASKKVHIRLCRTMTFLSSRRHLSVKLMSCWGQDCRWSVPQYNKHLRALRRTCKLSLSEVWFVWFGVVRARVKWQNTVDEKCRGRHVNGGRKIEYPEKGTSGVASCYRRCCCCCCCCCCCVCVRSFLRMQPTF